MNGNPRVVLYNRVSTNNGQDPEVQSREIRECCERRGWKLADEYVDVGISGAKERRPDLDINSLTSRGTKTPSGQSPPYLMKFRGVG